LIAALQAAFVFCPNPRAMPWAILFEPLRALSEQHFDHFGALSEQHCYQPERLKWDSPGHRHGYAKKENAA
jgi:hypothetical protein